MSSLPSSADATPLSVESRDALRATASAALGPRYNPWVHLAVPSTVGLGLLAGSLLTLRDLRLVELLLVPAVFVLSNAVEWRAHKLVLHRRNRLLPMLYDRHTPQHHRIFLTEDMEVRSTREFGLVLIPAFGILAIFAVTFPVTLGLALAGQRNLAALFVATTMGYVVSYEWLHLAYHLPATSFVGGLRLVRVLRRHHATHHAPALMQRWNFNVTLPLWDWVRGTLYRGDAHRVEAQ